MENEKDISEAGKRATPQEKAEAKKYYKKNKKKIMKHRKAVASGSVKVDKDLSKAQKKRKIYSSDDEMSEATLVKKSASERRKNAKKARLYRMKNKSKIMAAARRRKNKPVNLKKSRLMKRVAQLYDSVYDGVNDAFTLACSYCDGEKYEACIKEEGMITIELPVTDMEDVESIADVASNYDVQIVSPDSEGDEDCCVIISGSEEDLASIMTDLGIEDASVADFEIDDDDMDEEEYERVPSKAFAEAFDDMADYDDEDDEDDDEKEDKEDDDKEDKDDEDDMSESFKFDRPAKRLVERAASNRRESISSVISEQFSESVVFGSLNESESNELKDLFINIVDKVLYESEVKIAKDAIRECEAYVENVLLPEITSKFDDEYVPRIMESVNNDVDRYLKFVAENVVEDLSSKNMIVKSTKTSQLESFAEDLVSLIEERLQIVPEREDALESMSQKISDLRESLEDTMTEKKKLLGKLNDVKKKNYAYENMPEGISESTREKLMELVEEELIIENESYTSFCKAFDTAAEQAAQKPREPKKIQESVTKDAKKIDTASLADLVKRLG